MRYIILVVLASLAGNVKAQLRYTGSVEGGLQNGSIGTKGYFQSSHGIAYGQWAIALGAGIDYYRYRTVPVYAEIRRELGKQQVRPFLMASIGVNLAWPTELQKQEVDGWWQPSPGKFQDGLYTRAGGGVLFETGKRLQTMINIAYSYKTTRTSYTNVFTGPWPSEPTDKTIEYHMPRLSIGFGLVFQ